MENLRHFIRETIRQNLLESPTSQNAVERAKCIKEKLEKEFDRQYELSGGKDGTWIEIRQEIRRIDQFLKDGRFMMSSDEENQKMEEFLSGLDYSDSHTYRKGESKGHLPNTKSKVPVFRAVGSDKTLFRGVSLKDWERIKRQGFIDSDMRDAISRSEGINLGQRPNTAKYYLPANSEGVILAISPRDLDLYILDDEYLRSFEPIPVENVIRVSDVFTKNEVGAILTNDAHKKINELIGRMSDLGIDIGC